MVTHFGEDDTGIAQASLVGVAVVASVDQAIEVVGQAGLTASTCPAQSRIGVSPASQTQIAERVVSWATSSAL
ncbi:hypothetical protein [Saccharothrix syringae]|uniref:Uncharacterized protein n=1 Tax=Saccharothrix syringae TaxID=103733 RepID=A0A5Q0H3I4_SACSY|nr:hypothetical protein [Saccharothrix syringae]QFZ20370.1 hypothetical protein EKG83_25755 [Saccharothrix syringae]